jgi:hypothetical protein
MALFPFTFFLHILVEKGTHTMSPLFLRLSGWFLLFGGLFMAVTVFHPPTSPTVTALITLLGGGLLILGLPALYVRQAKQVDWVGLVGLVIIWLDMLIFPVQGGIAGLVPAFKLPDFLFLIGPLTIIGTLMFGIMTIGAHVFPRWLGWSIFVGYIIAFIGNFLPDNLANIAPFIANPGEWLFFLSFSAFGLVLLSQRNVQQERSVATSGARDALSSDM